MRPDNTGSSGDAPWAGRRGGRRRSGGAPPSGPEQERLIAAWFAGRIPDGWFEGPVTIEVDQDELQVVGSLPAPQLPEGASEEEVRVAEQARISGFREDSRGGRMRIAEEAQPAFRAPCRGAPSAVAPGCSSPPRAFRS